MKDTAMGGSGTTVTPEPLYALTLWQPWASLIAVGAKTIETRSWRAPESLIGERIVVHAAARLTREQRAITYSDPIGGALNDAGVFLGGDCAALPVGAIVATATLSACVPIVEHLPQWTHAPYASAMGDGMVVVRLQDSSVQACPARYESAAFGDFTPGRWAWLLDDIAPTTERCPADCRIIALDDEDDFDAEAGGYRICAGSTPIGGGTLEAWSTCPVCDGAGRCDPIPAKGKQRLWRWTPTAGSNGSPADHREDA